MAHGNLSDFVFLGMLAIVVQWFAAPDTLYADLGPFKAQFKAKGAAMDAMVKLAAGLILTIGLSLSGVKWNPINGKMGGLATFITVGYIAFCLFKADGDAFVPRLFYAYLGVLLVGGVHIFFFPSNPLVKTLMKDVKNNHGNFSDMVAMGLFGAAAAAVFYPDHLFMDIGPIKAQFSAKSDDLSLMIKFVGCLMLIWGCILSGVKWNPINGKMAGAGGFICTGVIAYSTFKADKDVFVPRVFYIYAALMFFSALHIFAFPSNPVPPKAGKDAKKKA